MESRSETFLVSQSGPLLHTLRWGDPDRPALVLLHGGGANAHWWDHIAPVLATGFHVVALDFRGHGDSQRTEAVEAGAFDRDLAALLNELGDRPPVLVGHSMGAHVALSRAARHPTAALVLLDPSRGSDRRHSRRLRLALSFRQSYASYQEAVERYRFLPDAEHVSEALRRHIAEHSVGREASGRWGYKFDARWFGLRGGARPDPREVDCPTLVVRGEESTILSEEGARELCEELPRGELVTLARAGHHVQLDRPEALTDAVVRFVGRHVPVRGATAAATTATGPDGPSQAVGPIATRRSQT